MTDGIMLMIGDDGKATLYDDTYDLTIHCESEEEQNEVKKALESIPKWIPCSERLPEYEEYVIVTFIDKSTIDTKVLSVRRIETFDGWCWSDFADEYTWEKDEIIAWMPLPEPYKGDEEK